MVFYLQKVIKCLSNIIYGVSSHIRKAISTRIIRVIFSHSFHAYFVIWFLNGIFDPLNLIELKTGLVQSYHERKTRSLAPLRHKIDISPKLLADYLRNMQTKANTLRIKLLWRFQKPKKFKQLGFILFLDSYASILHSDLYHPMACSSVMLSVLKKRDFIFRVD